MNSREKRKLAAVDHNKKRQAQKDLEQDKIDNPEKYKKVRSVRRSRKVQGLITAAMALSLNGFDTRHSKDT